MTFICGLAPSELLQRAIPSYSVWGHGIYAWGGQGRETVTHTPKVGVSHHRTLRSLPPFQPGPATYLWGPVQNANLGPPCSNIIISGWPQQSVKPSTQLRRSHAVMLALPPPRFHSPAPSSQGCVGLLLQGIPEMLRSQILILLVVPLFPNSGQVCCA